MSECSSAQSEVPRPREENKNSLAPFLDRGCGETQRGSRKQTLRGEILALYEALETELRRIGPRCEVSGRCCRFRDYGHMLFLSTVEAEILLESPPPGDVALAAERCPYQQGVLCTARERRPLGCRVFFCDPAYAPFMQEIAERYTRALKSIVSKHGREWHYGPLTAILKNVLESQEKAEGARHFDVGAPQATSPARRAERCT